MKQIAPLAIKHVPAGKALPSDCRFRDDLVYLLSDDLENSQHFKEKLEQRQREDRKLRKEYQKNAKKAKSKPKRNRSRVMG